MAGRRTRPFQTYPARSTSDDHRLAVVTRFVGHGLVVVGVEGLALGGQLDQALLLEHVGQGLGDGLRRRIAVLGGGVTGVEHRQQVGDQGLGGPLGHLVLLLRAPRLR